MNDISARYLTLIEELINSKAIKDSKELAVTIGVSTSSMTEISKGRTNVGLSIIHKTVLKFPEINLDWLIRGEGNIFNTKSTENATITNGGVNGGKIGGKRKVQKMPPNDEVAIYNPDKPKPSIASDTKGTYITSGVTNLAIPSEHGIPLIPFDAAAGYMSGDGVQVMEYECEHYIVPTFKGAEFLIRITGMSMYPKYASGDIVACARLPLDTFFQWNKVYVVDSQQGILIKRIKQGRDDAHISLVSENKEFEPFELHRNELNSIALVIGLIRLE